MKVKLFGKTKEIIGSSELIITDDLTCVADLKTHLIQQYPELEDLSYLAIAINETYAEDDTLIGINDTVALLPPVSGG